MITKLFLALIIGLVATVAIMQHDPLVCEAARTRAESLLAAMGECQVSVGQASLDIFSPELILSDVRMSSYSDDQWRWQAAQLKVSFSWLHFLSYGTIGMHIDIDHFQGTTQMHDGALAIMPHLLRFLYAPMGAIVTFVESLTLRTSSITAIDPMHKVQFFGAWQSATKRISGVVKTSVFIIDGQLFCAGVQGIHSMHGVVAVSAPYAVGMQGLGIQGKGSMTLTQADPAHAECAVQGSWQADHGVITLNNNDRSLCVDHCTLQMKDDALHAQISAHLPLEYLNRLITANEPSRIISGTCAIDLNATMRGAALESVQGSASLHTFACDGWCMTAPCTASFAYEHDLWSGALEIGIGQPWALSGQWQWRDDLGHCSVRNVHRIALPALSAWAIDPDGMHVDCTLHKDLHCTGSYRARLTDARRDGRMLDVAGHGEATPKSWAVTGTVPDAHYTLRGSCAPVPCIEQITSVNDKGDVQLQLYAVPHDTNHVAGTLSFAWLNGLLMQQGLNLVQGDAQLAAAIRFGQTTVVDLNLAQGSLRLGNTHNFIKELTAHATCDFVRKQVIMDTLECQLYKGSIKSKHAVVQLDDAFSIAHAYASVAVNHLLLNSNKDMFAILSGSARMQYAADQPQANIKGALLVERSQIAGMHCVDLLKASAASSELKEFKQSGLLDAECDITLESLAPVRLNTPLLQANAHLDLHLQGALHTPDVSGSIDLVSGKIMFPYKPLHLIHGTLIFLPRRLEDPIIEITAKNTIKRYNVGMQIVGSLKEPRVLLSAAPSLTDEQIIGLLFVGTHTASLSALMPTVAVNNLAHLIFGAQAPFDATRLLKKIPLPFEHIRLIPSLSDQTARGGLRGSIEIDINERWRAYIQRNFTLTEDTRFELEYAVSDDMSVRGVRDEQGDVGAEVEMRWKF